MKVTFLMRTLGYGGAERQLVALARGLHERGHRVHVGVFYPGGPLERDLRDAGVAVIGLAKRHRWDLFGFAMKLARFARAERPDVFHGYLAMSNILSLLTRPLHRGRVVWGIRGSDMDLARYHWLSRLEERLERWLARFPDLVIANSRAGRADSIRHGFPERTIVVIPNGIDTERFRLDAEGRRALRAELGVAAGEPLIGRIGRLDPQKDYPTFLQAAARLVAERPSARFLCVGDGPPAYAHALRATADRLGLGGRLVWAGARDDMPTVYSALDVAVSSSAFGEGTPNVVAEAMACGVPCVVTDCGDSAWTVGDLGQIVPVNDPAALADAVARTLDEVARGQVDRTALRDRVLTRLSFRNLVVTTEAALRDVIEGEGAA